MSICVGGLICSCGRCDDADEQLPMEELCDECRRKWILKRTSERGREIARLENKAVRRASGEGVRTSRRGLNFPGALVIAAMWAADGAIAFVSVEAAMSLGILMGLVTVLTFMFAYDPD